MDTPENVRKDLVKNLPASIASEVSCFTFYDSHPRDTRKIDLTVCTTQGEVYEFYDRQIISSIFLENIKTIKELLLRRNIEERCKVFYVLVSESEIIILSSENDTLHVHQRINHVEKYEFVDEECVGENCLKVTCNDDAVPVTFDSNFNICQPILVPKNKKSSDSLPILMQLSRKLIEAKFNVKKNEALLRQYTELNQAATFCLYEQGNSITDDSIFKTGRSLILNTLKIKTKAPILKICNRKVVVLVNIENSDDVSIDNLHILLHGSSSLSFSYTTRIYKRIISPPYWQEKTFNCLKSNDEHCAVAVLDLKELKYNMSSSVDFELVLSYKKFGKTYLVPLENISLTAIDTMNDKFDIIIDHTGDNHHQILAVLATSHKTDLVLLHLRESHGKEISIYDELHRILKFDAVRTMKNVLVHNQSPYHILFGLTLVFNTENTYENGVGISVYSRSPAQVLAFINCLYNVVPYRLLATLADFKITSKTDDMSQYNFNGTKHISQINASTYANAILEQSKTILEYFDKCMIKMNDSTDPDVRNKVGQEIHLLSLGITEYGSFRNELLKKGLNGIQCSKMSNLSTNVNKDSYEVMEA